MTLLQAFTSWRCVGMHDHQSYKKDFTNEIILFQLDRIRFVLCSYLRTRLKKVCTNWLSMHTCFFSFLRSSTFLMWYPFPYTFLYSLPDSVFFSSTVCAKDFTFSSLHTFPISLASSISLLPSPPSFPSFFFSSAPPSPPSPPQHTHTFPD